MVTFLRNQVVTFLRKLVVTLSGFSTLVLAVPFLLIPHTLQSDTTLVNCEIDVECIDRVPFYEPLELINPVSGGDISAILSVWGDSRDEGRRKHQGMDIFARRGTPVVAPIDGVVSRVGWNVLGGKVVWLDSKRTQHSFYFAHLAETKVCVGDHVSQGDILGTVGNTGNARFTPPHLHFGIYYINSRKAMNREVVWKGKIPSRLPDTMLASAW